MAEDAVGGEHPDLGDLLAALRRTALFRRVAPAALRAFVKQLLATGGGLRTLQADEVLYDAGTAADAMFVVLTGRFEERSAADHGSLLNEAGPGEVLGEAEVFAEEPRAAAVDGGAANQRLRGSAAVCTEAGRVFVIPQLAAEDFAAKNPEFMLGVLRSVATDAVRLMDDQREDDAILQEYFDGATACLVPAPYRCRDVSLYIAYGQAPDGDFGRFLPDGVWPFALMPDVFLIVFASFRELTQPNRPYARPFRYNETALFVPAFSVHDPLPLLPFLPVAYAPVVYPDSTMATTLGREIFGFRKRNARTYIEPDRRRARLRLDGAQVARLTFESADAPLEEFWRAAPRLIAGGEKLLRRLGCDTSEAGLVSFVNRWLRILPNVPVLNLKQIPGPGHCDGACRYEVNELVLSPFRLERVRAVRAITGVDLRLTGNIPFAGAELAAPVGVRVDCDFDLLTGHVFKHYRSRREPLPACR